jgi:TolB-like protein
VIEPSHAVFLSYASQDAAAAQKICQTLRAAGIEVWFDQSELRGGDAWDQSIRKQIKTCGLFLPVISHTTHDRVEGYFRLEWKLAVDRSHLIAADQAFLLPVVIDDTRDDDERVPERFREVQWTRLPGGVTPAAFVERVQRLLSGEPAQGPTGTGSPVARVSAAPATRKRVLASWRSKPALLATIAVVVVALGYFVANRLLPSKRSAEVGGATAPVAQRAPATAFAPPPHSIAVLPFVNMSGDKEQEYFSDGLSEELLNDLARIDELQVAARTSAFSFKGKDTDISTIAHKLNVGAVLEGSVRRSGNTIRITAQLINAVTGFHLWSETYDRNLGDILKLQTEIANAVASALKISLLRDTAAKIALGGTDNPAAFDSYLRALKAYETFHDENDVRTSIALYTEAIRLDPAFALAYAGRSVALCEYAINFATGLAFRDHLEKAKVDAVKALTLAPELAEGHLASARAYETSLDFTPASQEYERALTLAPGNARALRFYGRFAVLMGEGDAGLIAVRRAVVLDPLNAAAHELLGVSLYFLRRYEESIAALADAHALDPQDPDPQIMAGYPHYMLGNLQGARSSCEIKPQTSDGYFCLALVYFKLGRRADAQSTLAKLRAARGDDGAYEYTVIYTQWGDTGKALDWLERAMRLHRPWLERVKMAPALDPLRTQPRFQAVERELRFPN